MKVKVEALKIFENYTDSERGIVPKEGDTWMTSKERAEMLEKKGFIKIVEAKIENEPVKEVKKSTRSKRQ
jgi:hypothetical protein